MSEVPAGLAPVFPPPYGYVSINKGTGGVVVVDVPGRKVVTTLATGPALQSSMAPLRRILLVSAGSNVQVIQPAKTPSVAGSFSVGAAPTESGFVRDGSRAYVATFAASLAARVDMPGLGVTGIPLSFPGGGMVVSPDMTSAYMPAFVPMPFPGSWKLFVLDLGTDKLGPEYDVDDYANAAVITPDSRFVYLSHATPPHITVFDTTLRSIVATIPDGSSAEYSGMMAITPDGTRIYVGIGQGSDQIVMIDVATNKITDRITMPSTTLKQFPALAVTPDNRFLCAAYGETGRVWVVDTVTNTVVTPDINVGKDCAWITFGPPLASAISSNFYIAGPAVNTFAVDGEPPLGFSTHPSGGTAPYCLAPSPDGRRLYVTNRGTHDLSVIDLFTNNVLASAKTQRSPMGVDVSPDSATIYVANSGSGTMSILDAKTLTDAPVGVGSNPVRVAAAPDGARVYVTNSTEDSVSVFDVASRMVNTLTGFDSPLGVAVSPDSMRVYVCNFGTANISVIDAATLTLLPPIRVGSQPSAIAISADGKWIYVVNTRDKTLSVIEAATNTVFAPIRVGDDPTGVAVSLDGRHIRVTNGGSDTITSIEHTPPATWTVIGTHAFGSSPGEVRAGKIWIGYPE